MIYMSLAALTTALALCADKTKGAFRVLFVAVWISLFCFVAGARDDTVGVDVLVYGRNAYVCASGYDLHAFLGSFYGVKDGVGTAFLFWFAARFSADFGFFLAVVQLACVLPYCIGTYRANRDCTWFSVFFYALYVFPLSLCLMKQMIACSIVFLAFSFIKEKRFDAFAACIVLACSFHVTALVAIVLYPLACELIHEHSGKRSFFGRNGRILLPVTLLAGLFLAFLFRDQLLSALAALKDSYSSQVVSMSESHLVAAPLILLAPIAYVALSRKKRVWDTVLDHEMSQGYALEISILVVLLIGICLSELSAFSSQMTRISHYFVILLPFYCLQLQKHAKGFYVLMILFAVFCYFVLTILIQGIGGVEPYTSAFLGLKG